MEMAMLTNDFRIKRNGNRIGLGAVMVVALIATSAATANAAPVTGSTSPIPPGYHAVTSTKGEQVLVPDGSPQNKLAWLAAHPSGGTVSGPSSISLPSSAKAGTGLVTPNASTVNASSLSSSGSQSVLGASIEATGGTNIIWSDNTCADIVDFFSSSVHDTWLGQSPFNATEISPSMSWWLTGVAVNVSIPLGVSFSGAGSEVTYAPGAVSNTWNASAYYSYPVTESACAVWSANFQTYGDFLFGSSWYRVQGS